MSIPFTLTNDSIVVIHQGKSHTVQKGTPNFVNLRQALIEERWGDVPNYVSVGKSLDSWAKGRFTFSTSLDQFSYDGRELPQSLNKRIIAMATAGENPVALFNFFERLAKNPSMRSVEQLYPFLEHSGIAITEDGHFLAYKGVTSDYKDCHTNTINNLPGEIVKVPRNQVSDDPRQACHFGLHAGSKSYASSYGSRLTVVKIDPEHVVCVPYDSSEKLRCCEYFVIGNAGDQLSSTTHDESDLPPDEKPSEPDYQNEQENDAEIEEAPVRGIPTDIVHFDDDQDFVEVKPVMADPVKTAGGMTIPKKYEEVALKPFEELMKEPLDKLRELATYGLKIIGASKIPGGKLALVNKIVEVRGSREE